MKDYPTSVVVASRELFHATLVQRVLSNMAMRVYTSQVRYNDSNQHAMLQRETPHPSMNRRTIACCILSAELATGMSNRRMLSACSSVVL